MNALVNFIKGILGFESSADMIGLARFTDGTTQTRTPKNKVQNKKDCTLTEMLRRTY